MARRDDLVFLASLARAQPGACPPQTNTDQRPPGRDEEMSPLHTRSALLLPGRHGICLNRAATPRPPVPRTLRPSPTPPDRPRPRVDSRPPTPSATTQVRSATAWPAISSGPNPP